MKVTKLIIVLMATIVSGNVLAYGSSSSKKACTKPKFTQFTPVHLSEVLPESEFSFLASALANPKTIEVSAKKQHVDVAITKVNRGYIVKGMLPASLQKNYARIAIQATVTNNCKASDGWLLKIEAQ